MMEKKVYRQTNRQTDKQTNIITEKAKTIYPLYTSYRGYKKYATEISIGEKEKWTNKGTDKRYVAVLLLHNTTHHYQALYQISES